MNEFYCTECGVLFWNKEKYVGVCANKECRSHSEQTNSRLYNCDSMPFAYYLRDNSKLVVEKQWSSIGFAAEDRLTKYKELGIKVL